MKIFVQNDPTDGFRPIKSESWKSPILDLAQILKLGIDYKENKIEKILHFV